MGWEDEMLQTLGIWPHWKTNALYMYTKHMWHKVKKCHVELTLYSQTSELSDDPVLLH